MVKKRKRSRNILGPGFGDFQANVGKLDASVSVVMAWIFGVILILGALACVVMAFIPMTFIPSFGPDKCLDDDQACKEENKLNGPPPKKKMHPLLLLVAAGLVGLAIFIIWISKWWKKTVTTNRTAAQIGGTMAEVGMVQNLLGRR